MATVEEPARRSPFIEKIVVHGRGRFDLETEADLFGAQLSAQLRAARQHTMIICNKTIANVLACAWLVLPAPSGSRPGRDGSVLPHLGPVYDIVFYCCDNYTHEQAGGPYRAKVLDLQSAADRDAVVLASLWRRGLLTPHDACPLPGTRCHHPLRAKVAPRWTARMMAAVYWTVSDGSLPGSAHTSWEHLAGSPMTGSPSQ